MKKLFMLFALVSVIVLAACSSKNKEDLGLERRAPDASQAVSNAPLILPPNYNLRPVVPMEKTS